MISYCIFIKSKYRAVAETVTSTQYAMSLSLAVVCICWIASFLAAILFDLSDLHKTSQE